MTNQLFLPHPKHFLWFRPLQRRDVSENEKVLPLRILISKKINTYTLKYKVLLIMKIRKEIIVWMFEKSQKIYTKYIKKNKPWNINKSNLLGYPDASFGKHLGEFLEENGFDLIPKAVCHDAYYVLTDYGTKVEDEIAQQYLCYGNGKRSIYLYGVITIGTIILPDYLSFYMKSYKIGKSANLFHNLDFKSLLNTSLIDLQSCIFSKSHLINLIKS